MKILNNALREKGWKVVFLLRLIPAPFALMSYLLGSTAVNVRDYLIGSTGITCFTMLYCYSGVCLRELHHSSVDDLDHPHTRSHAIGLICFEVILALAVGSYIAIMAKKELKKYEK